MRWLLDQGVPRSAAGVLRARGEDAVHTGEVGLATAEDEVILKWARREMRVIVTLDADFHQLLALTEQRAPSVIRVRLQGLDAEAVVSLVLEVRAVCEDDLQRGAVVTVNENNIRVRLLPLP